MSGRQRGTTANGWLSGEALVDERGAQVSALSYPHLLSSEIFRSTEEFYRRFYFRPRKIVTIAKEMIVDPRVMQRRLREGREFLRFLTVHRREEARPAAKAVDATKGVAQPRVQLGNLLAVTVRSAGRPRPSVYACRRA